MIKLNDLKPFLLAVLLALLPLIGTAQGGKLAKANAFFENYDYAKAIPLYEKVQEKNPDALAVSLALGDAYYFISDWEKTVENYKFYQEEQGSLPAKQVFRYIHALKAVGNVATANKVAKVYVGGPLQKDTMLLEISQTLSPVNVLETELLVTDTNFNSPYADMTPTFYRDGLIFASARDTGNLSRRRHGWNEKPFLDLYHVSLNASKLANKKPKKIVGGLNTKSHESSPVLTKDDKTIYFTRNFNTVDGGKVSRLAIFKAVPNRDYVWEETLLSFNETTSSAVHPTLSPDERTLYFSSDREGGFGETDIYSVAIKNDGSFGEPVNMGAQINTAGHDSYPFMGANNRLFFASNGHPGFGGLDVFVVSLEVGNQSNVVFNLGDGLNSSADDFGLILDDKEKFGFVTSNRNGGDGDDDIYKVELIEAIILTPVIHGLVLNSKNEAIVAGAEVSFMNYLSQEIVSVKTDEKGFFELNWTNKGSKINLSASKQGFDTKRESFLLENYADKLMVIYLDPETDLAETLQLDPIYFNFDSATIVEKSKGTLDILVEHLKEYPTLQIEVRSHTDSRGNDGYNLALSGSRALTTRDYIMSQGIEASRVKSLGMGEGNLRNKCENGFPCTEEEHRLNRRSEFIVLKVKEVEIE